MSINPRELRIGNKVFSKEKDLIGTIKEIWEDGVTLDLFTFGSDEYKLDDIEPIPLTEEWLVKFGFEGYSNPNMTGSKIFRINYFRLIIVEDRISLRDFHEIQRIIPYVHQLQNLYFALTGIELEIK